MHPVTGGRQEPTCQAPEFRQTAWSEWEGVCVWVLLSVISTRCPTLPVRNKAKQSIYTTLKLPRRQPLSNNQEERKSMVNRRMKQLVCAEGHLILRPYSLTLDMFQRQHDASYRAAYEGDPHSWRTMTERTNKNRMLWYCINHIIMSVITLSNMVLP